MGWGSSQITINVDIFENDKQEILELYTIKELKEEIKRREENDIKEEDEKIKHNYNFDFDIDVDDYLDEFLYACNDNGIIEELESRGFSVADDKNVIVGGYPNREELSKMLGLRPWATNEQILEELNYVL